MTAASLLTAAGLSCVLAGASAFVPVREGASAFASSSALQRPHSLQHSFPLPLPLQQPLPLQMSGSVGDGDGDGGRGDLLGGAARALATAALGAALATSVVFGGGAASLAAADEAASAGFEEFAAKGGVMKTDPSCFFEQCGDQSRACFTNPSCLKGITCLGNCRGEQLCATQCFARFGSERLNDWLSCTLEDKQCVVTGVAQDTSAFYSDPPKTKAMEKFTPSDLEGKWYKVLGYNPKYDTYPCQTNTFTSRSDGGLDNDIVFRVPKPDGGGAWENNFVESMANQRGPQGKASMTVEGKMFGLTFHEQWYVLGKGEGWRVVAYRGDTQQGPYDGAFVYTKERDALQGPAGAGIQGSVDAVLREAGLDPKQMTTIDNSCPADGTSTAGVSKEDASKDKLEWKDVFELTEWFRPGTLKKNADFDPNAM